MKTRLITVAVATALFSGYTFAANMQGEQEMTDHMETQIGAGLPDFNQLDNDRDGAINRAEANRRNGLADNWDDFDKNEDGQLSRSEFSAFEKEDLQDRAKMQERAADEAEDRIDNAN